MTAIANEFSLKPDPKLARLIRKQYYGDFSAPPRGSVMLTSVVLGSLAFFAGAISVFVV